MEADQSENEKLRKQIQFLTDAIANAKSRRRDGTHPLPYHNFPANNTRTGYSASLCRPSLQKASSHIRFAERNTRPFAKTFSQEHSHFMGQAPANAIARQSELQYSIKDANMQPDQMLEIKRRPNERQPTGLPTQSLKSRDGLYVPSGDDLDSVKLKSATLVTNSAKSDPSRNRIINTNSTEQKKNEMQVLTDKNTAMKSSSNSGNLKQTQVKSNSNLLQKEIEKMQSKIADLKKSLEQKQMCRSSSVIDKCKVEEKKCQSKPILENPLKGNDNQSCQKSERSVKSQFLKQESSISSNSTMSATKTDSLVQNKDVKFSSDTHQNKGQKTANILGAQTNAGMSNVKSMFKDVTSKLEPPLSDLISLSKYKLTRLATSPTKQSPSKSTAPSKVSENTAINVIGMFNLDMKSENSLSQNQTHYPSCISVKKSKYYSGTPAKFIKKSKYSITRVKSSQKKGLVQKNVRNKLSPPAKFLSLSKYAIKRVRRSLSDEHRQLVQKGTSITKASDKLKNNDPYSSQPSVRVLRSKFKMEKVQPHPNIKSCYSLSGSNSSYKFNQRGSYRQRKYRPFIQKYQDKQYRRTGFGYNSYYNIGGYISRFKGQGHPHYRNEHGRYGKHFHHYTYSRRQAVSDRYLRRRLQRLRDSVPFNPKHRLDRRTTVQDIKTPVNFIMINGMLYKSNTKSLVKAVSQKTHPSKPTTGVEEPKIKKLDTTNMKTVTVRGVKFKVDSKGRSLKRVHQQGLVEDKPDVSSSTTTKAGQISRVDIGGVTYVQTKPGTLERVGSVKSRMAATRVVNKTVHRAAAKYKKDNTKVLKKKKYCMFYNRFGKCNKKGSCTYIHDPEKVAVCTRFLRGTCKVKDCPFSHIVSKDKMPVCSYYLKGVCNRDDCPYLHVNVNRDAEICQDFVKGYCPQGEKCKKKHILKCPEFTQTGSCSKGKKCTLQHRRGKRKQQTIDQSTEENSKKPKLLEQATLPLASVITKEENTVSLEMDTNKTNKQASDIDSEIDLPFKERKLPAYISLKTNTSKVKEDVVVILDSEQKQNVKASMKIRPQL